MFSGMVQKGTWDITCGASGFERRDANGMVYVGFDMDLPWISNCIG